MLDLMRQANRRRWFVWIVILFVVASFVLAIFAIWGGAATGGGSSADLTWVARVNSVEISANDFERQLRFIENNYRQTFGDQYEAIAPNLNLELRAFQQLLGQTLAYTEAVRLGLGASEQEIADAIRSYAVFQRSGRFIGREQYINELTARGYNVADYEREVGKELTVDKLRDVMATMVSLTEAEVEEAYEQEGRFAELDYVLLREKDYQVTEEPSSREIEAWFRDHRDQYKTPEKRRARYILIEREPLLQAVDVPESEIEAHYATNKDTLYTTPEQRRASHILFKVASDGPPDAAQAAEARARQVLERIRQGEDFVRMARENSEDTASAPEGDLGWFGRGRMVPEFEQAAFSLPEGQVSDLVRTQFGFHIIKVTGSRPAGPRPLAEVRDQIRQQLAFTRGQEALQKKADEFTARLGMQVSTFEGTAGELGYPVKDSGLFAQGEPMGDLGMAPQASEEAFRLEPGKTSSPIVTSQGTVFLQVAEIQPPQLAPMESVRDQVKLDVSREKSLARARAAAREIVSAGAAGFKAAADARKAEVQSTGEITRATAPGLFNEAAKDAVFAPTPQELLGPIDVSEGVLVVRMIKSGPTFVEEIAARKADLREQLSSRKREDAFIALVQRLQRTATIEQNAAFIEELARRSSRTSRASG